MTKIYLVRHAQAEGNLYRRAHGMYDSCVTRRGTCADCRRCGAALPTTRWSRVFQSAAAHPDHGGGHL